MNHDRVEDAQVEEVLWQAGQSAPFSPRSLTEGRPHCAGVLIVDRGSVLVTLAADGIAAADADGRQWNVGGVGGGQETGENIWDTAAREAREELGVEVRLLHSATTHLHDVDTDDLHSSNATDAPAPFAVQRTRNRDPHTPFRPGLPAGTYTYFVLMMCRI